MSQIHWLTDIIGSFTNAGDWSGGVVPGASDDAILDAVGSSFTVTSNLVETVHSVQLAANATLSVVGHTFTATDGTGAGANAGVILVGAGATLEAGGTVTNTGTIALYGTGGGKDAATLIFDNFFDTGPTTLSGGGDILLGGQGHDKIMATTGRYSIAVVYNLDNTIAGSGVIAKHMDVINGDDAVVDANGVSPLVIRAEMAQNRGLIEATGSGGIVFKKAIIANRKTGVVLEAPGSRIEFDQSYMAGGTLQAQGAGTIAMRSSRLAGYISGAPLTLNANLKVFGTLGLQRTIENNGMISFAYGIINLEYESSVTLEGDGDIDLKNGSIYGGQSGTLTLASGTISGPGQIYQRGNAFHLAIGAHGVIDSDANRRLTLDTDSTIANGGLFESTGSGEVLVDDAIVNTGTLSVQSGTFKVKGAVGGDGVANIGGGTLDFDSTLAQGVTFTGGGVLELGQSRQFKDAVTGFSTSGATALDLDDIDFVGANEATFSGTVSGGVLTVTDGTHTANIKLVGDYLGATFVASSDGHKETDVVATSPQTPSAAHFVSAMAVMNGRGAAVGFIDSRAVSNGRQMMLTAPRLATV